MKKCFYSLFLCFLILTACKKEEDNPEIISNPYIRVIHFGVTQAYRGDTLTYNVTNIDTNDFNVFLGDWPCEIVNYKNETLRFIISDNCPVDSLVGMVYKEQQVNIPLYFRNNQDSMLYQNQSFIVLVNPKVRFVSSLTNSQYGDEIIIKGQDIDLDKIRIEFNALEGVTISNSATERIVKIPDSCGSGSLKIYYFDYENKQLLYKAPFEIDYLPTVYKLPKNIHTVYPSGEEYDYAVAFSDDNQVTLYDINSEWSREFFYDLWHHCVVSKLYRDGDLYRVDSIEHTENQIIDNCYDVMYQYDTIQTIYNLNEFNKIDEVITRSYENEQYETVSHTQFDYFEDSCFILYNDNGIINIGYTNEMYVLFDNKNYRQPVQPKNSLIGTYTGPLALGLETHDFPGNVMYKGYSNSGTEIDLYYDAYGFLVKEEVYYLSYYNYIKELTKTVYTEY